MLAAPKQGSRRPEGPAFAALLWRARRHLAWGRVPLSVLAFLLLAVAGWPRSGMAVAGAIWVCLSLALEVAAAEERGAVARAEVSRLCDIRAHQQVLLEATRVMSAVLDLDQALVTVVDQVAGRTRFHQCALILGPASDGEFRVAACRGLLPEHVRQISQVLQGPMRAYSPVEWARLTLASVVVEDVRRDPRLGPLRDDLQASGVGALLCCPMVWQEKFIGALLVLHDTARCFDPDDVFLLSTLAVQAAMAVENARLYTISEGQRRQLDRAVAFLQVVSAAFTRSRVGVNLLVKQVAQATARLFEPSSVFIVISKAQGARPLQVAEACGVNLDEALRTRAMLFERDASDPEWHFAWPSALSLPIVLDSQRLGHFEIYLSGEGRRLDQEELTILNAFVHLTASALGNAHLVSHLRAAVDEVERAWMGTLEALTSALETRDHETQGHSRRVVEYTLLLAQRLDVREEALVPIMRGALLHDIGKIGIPDSILRKQGPLSPEEWAVMKKHTLLGYQMLKAIEFLRDSLPVILYHHERFDGRGYPAGLVGTDIPLGARIFAVADAYDAITSDRPYRKAASHAHAIAEITRCRGTHFDPEVVEALTSLPEEELARIRNREWSYALDK